MPTYSYQCEACGEKFEAFQKITEGYLHKCPSCGKDTLMRGIGGGSATFQFKGSGFYETDYKKKSSSEKEEGCGCGKKKERCCRSDIIV